MTTLDTSLGSPYHKRVLELEDEGLCTSAAQGVADAEFARIKAPITAALAHNVAHLSYEEQAERFCSLADRLERELMRAQSKLRETR